MIPDHCCSRALQPKPASSLFTFCSLAAFLFAAPAGAQLPSVTGLLETPFSEAGRPGSTLGLAPRLLDSFREPFSNYAPFIGLRFRDSGTLHTTQAGVRTEDLTERETSISGRARLSTRMVCDFYLTGSQQSLLFSDSRLRPFAMEDRSSGGAVRFTLHLRAGELYAGLRDTRSDASLHSLALGSLIPLFTSPPPGSYGADATELAAGGIFNAGSRVRIEAAAAVENADASLTFASGQTRLRLPLRTSGGAWSVAALADLTPRASAAIFLQNARRSGQSAVTLTGHGDLGDATTSYSDRAWGVGARSGAGANDVYSVSYASQSWSAGSHAYGLDAAALGFDPANVDLAGYFMTSALSQRTIAVSWNHRYSSRRQLQVEYRHVQADPDAVLGYTASSFLTGLTQSRQFRTPTATTHLLRLRYTFPAGRIGLSIDLSQAIPQPLPRTGAPTSPPAPGPAAPARHSTGGWSINTAARYEF